MHRIVDGKWLNGKCEVEQIILGIDPGTSIMGYGVLRVEGKKAEMLAMKQLLPTTGYIRGGCSPIGMKKPFPTFFHLTCNDFEHIFVSAGLRGLQLKMAPTDLVAFVGATVADITVDNN